MEGQIDRRMQFWRSQLLDLTNRNALINFSFSKARPTSLPIAAPSGPEILAQLLQSASLEIRGAPVVEDEDEDEAIGHELINEDSRTGALRIVERTDEPPRGQAGLSIDPGYVQSFFDHEKTNRVANRLAIRSKEYEREQAVQTLYLVFGFLRWRESKEDGRTNRSPLFLIPVNLIPSGNGRNWRIQGKGEEPEFNQSLSVRLKQDFNLDLRVETGTETGLFDLTAALAEIANRVSAHQDWIVEPECHLAVLQYYKLRMYEDLGRQLELARANEVIQILADPQLSFRYAPEQLVDERVDLALRESAHLTVLEADGAQLRVIEAVRRGNNLVIEGPPGTGKSQTIANIIADAISTGKSVLFVSEKQAALDVVLSRLKEAGLDEYCLPLHDHRASRREVCQRLADRLSRIQDSRSGRDDVDDLGHLHRVRSELNEYQEELHRIREPLGWSVYEALGRLARAKQDQLPAFSIETRVLRGLNRQDLDKRLAVFSAAGNYADLLRAGGVGVWSGIDLNRVDTITGRSALKQGLLDLCDLLAQYILSIRELLRLHGHDDSSLPLSPQDLVKLGSFAERAKSIPVAWIDRNKLGARVELLTSIRRLELEAQSQKAYLERHFQPIPESVDLANLVDYYQSTGISRVFKFQARNSLKSLRSCAKGDWPKHASEALVVLSNWERARIIRKELSGAWSSVGSVFGETAPLVESLGVAEALDQLVGAGTLLDLNLPSDHLKAWLLAVQGVDDPSKVSALSEQARSLQEQLQVRALDVLGFFATQPDIRNVCSGFTELLECQAWALRLENAFGYLEHWVAAHRKVAEAQELGIGEVLDRLIVSSLSGNTWRDVVERDLIFGWLTEIYGSANSLARFTRAEQDRRIDEFRDLDHQVFRNTRIKARRKVDHAAQQAFDRYSSEVQLLRRYGRANRNHPPVRRLLKDIRHLLFGMTPCLLMSPLSVATYLEAGVFNFDLVIFDEASQVQPHDAIGAILRGKQLVVAGDPRQLPPTTFFDRSDGLDDDDTDESPLESILDELTARSMRTLPLLWHYRSRDESLIAWSNARIYGSRLITFPNPSGSISKGGDQSLQDLGVQFSYVSDGSYTNVRDSEEPSEYRGNAIEADRVIALIEQMADRCPSKSLGVVALNEGQCRVIERRLDALKSRRPDLLRYFREDKQQQFFLKALEKVQGDERDVMIISVGFGPDRESGGRIRYNFGPINRQGGERRLNVLVTRAREKLIVVSSMRASDLDPARLRSLGPKLLRDYLDFAERGSAVLVSDTSNEGEFESPFEEAVARSIEALGFGVTPQVGVSKFRIDLGVYDREYPGRFILGVECDGATYHRLASVRDRDRLRQEILEGYGWSFHRIWSTSWWADEKSEITRLERALESARHRFLREEEELKARLDERLEGALVGELFAESPVELPRGSRKSETPLELPPYVEYEMEIQPEDSISSASIDRVAHVIKACVEVEAPVHRELVGRRLARFWGHSRASSSVMNRIDAGAALAAQRGWIVQKGAIYWLPGQNLILPRGANVGGRPRDVDHIPTEEITAVMLMVARLDCFTEEEFVRQSARTLGYKRTGSEVMRRLRDAVTELVVDEKLLIADCGITVV